MRIGRERRDDRSFVCEVGAVRAERSEYERLAVRDVEYAASDLAEFGECCGELVEVRVADEEPTAEEEVSDRAIFSVEGLVFVMPRGFVLEEGIGVAPDGVRLGHCELTLVARDRAIAGRRPGESSSDGSAFPPGRFFGESEFEESSQTQVWPLFLRHQCY